MSKLVDIITQADEAEPTTTAIEESRQTDGPTDEDEPIRSFCCGFRRVRRNRSDKSAREQSSRRGQLGHSGGSSKNGRNKFAAVVPVSDSTEEPVNESGAVVDVSRIATREGDSPGPTPTSTPTPRIAKPSKGRSDCLQGGQLGPQVGDLIGRKTLVLDLDETLIHSSFHAVANADIVITVELEGEAHRVYVRKRPGVDEFLEAVSKLYEVVVFTASMAMYANPLLDELDPHGYVSFRLFRQACTKRANGYTKDLSLLGRDLQSVIIIDNSPVCYAMQPYNAIPISTWRHDPKDTQLYELVPILVSLVQVADVPTVLRQTVWAIED